jgi:hypothetical protein
LQIVERGFGFGRKCGFALAEVHRREELRGCAGARIGDGLRGIALVDWACCGAGAAAFLNRTVSVAIIQSIMVVRISGCSTADVAAFWSTGSLWLIKIVSSTIWTVIVLICGRSRCAIFFANTYSLERE